MAKLVEIFKGQTVTEQIDTINKNVGNVNDELVQLGKNALTIETTPIKSVNGKLGEVKLSAVDVSAFPNNSTIQELDINNIKTTGVYIGTITSNPYYLVVIRYSNTNIYQKLIGLKSSKFRRFTNAWSEWVEAYSKENPITASDVTGIELADTDTNLDVAMLNNGKFVKTQLTFNPSTKELTFGNDKYATQKYVDDKVNSIKSIIVTELPSDPVENTIYFVPANIGEKNQFNEWIWVNNQWEIIGGTNIDLTPFLTKDEATKTYATKSENDSKVSKTTTINNKPLSSNITLTAQDVGALPSDTKIETNAVNKYTNAEIEAKLTDGTFKPNDTFICLDNGTYEKGATYTYNNSQLNKITDNVLTRDVDQNIDGIKNFTGVLRANGIAVATTDDVTAVENKIPTIDKSLSTTSTNPAENQAITKELNTKAKQTDLEDLSSTVDLKASTSYVDEKIAQIPTPDVSGQIQAHNEDLEAHPDIREALSQKAGKDEIPTNTSQLTNNSGFITKAVNDLTNYYKKSETYTQAEINSRISAIPKFAIKVVTSLPTSDISNTTIYLLKTSTESQNLYDEYIYVDSKWEKLGTQKVDLTDYALKSEIPSVAGFIKNEPNAFDYNNLKGKPTIPTKLSELSGDATHRVVTDTEKSTWNNKSNFDGNYNSLSNKPTIPDISGLATKTELGNKYDKTGGTINGAISATGNVSGNYLIGNWFQAKGTTNLGSGTYDVPVIRNDGWIYKRTKSEFASDIGVPTSAEKSTWNGKQDKLVAGDNITISGNTISASGGGGGGNPTIIYEKAGQTDITYTTADREHVKIVDVTGTALKITNVDTLLGFKNIVIEYTELVTFFGSVYNDKLQFVLNKELFSFAGDYGISNSINFVSPNFIYNIKGITIVYSPTSGNLTITANISQSGTKYSYKDMKVYLV